MNAGSTSDIEFTRFISPPSLPPSPLLAHGKDLLRAQYSTWERQPTRAADLRHDVRLMLGPSSVATRQSFFLLQAKSHGDN